MPSFYFRTNMLNFRYIYSKGVVILENKDAVKFYNKTWFMWVTLIFVAPVGIFLMWKNKRYDKPARIALSLVFALIFIIAVAPKEDNKQVTSTTKVENATKQEVVEDKIGRAS